MLSTAFAMDREIHYRGNFLEYKRSPLDWCDIRAYGTLLDEEEDGFGHVSRLLPVSDAAKNKIWFGHVSRLLP